MILCGIDSSSRITALSLFKDGQYKEYKLIDLSKYKDAEKRIDEMIRSIYEVLDKWNPDVIYQEYTWVSQNPKVALMLTMIVGAVRGWAAKHMREWHKIVPAMWRAQLKLNEYMAERSKLKGRAIDYVYDKYGIVVPTDDVADAICIGEAGCMIYSKK